MQEIKMEKIDKILEEHGWDSTKIIAIMQAVQREYRYLPETVLKHISKKLGMSEAKLYSVATFYENFSLEPKGKYILRVCDGTACHVRKSVPILNQLRTELKLADGKKTTEDMLFTLETVSCLGACGLSPVMTVNDKVYPSMTPEKASELLQALRKGEGHV